jgi:hypothetical protein
MRYRAVTSTVANRVRQRYFDPSEDMERKFVGLGQRVRTRFESLGNCSDERCQDDTDSGCDIGVSNRNFSLARTDKEIRNPGLSTTLPVDYTLTPLIVSQGLISKWIQLL